MNDKESRQLNESVALAIGWQNNPIENNMFRFDRWLDENGYIIGDSGYLPDFASDPMAIGYLVAHLEKQMLSWWVEAQPDGLASATVCQFLQLRTPQHEGSCAGEALCRAYISHCERNPTNDD